MYLCKKNVRFSQYAVGREIQMGEWRACPRAHTRACARPGVYRGGGGTFSLGREETSLKSLGISMEQKCFRVIAGGLERTWLSYLEWAVLRRICVGCVAFQRSSYTGSGC